MQGTWIPLAPDFAPMFPTGLLDAVLHSQVLQPDPHEVSQARVPAPIHTGDALVGVQLERHVVDRSRSVLPEGRREPPPLLVPVLHDIGVPHHVPVLPVVVRQREHLRRDPFNA